ncbi:MAG: DUF1573 domain-containing protein [Bacteroidia bacterium]|nr:DUF1573 domain-containing protein [Bacteroidia bacterium]MDW8158940.1 DUF1573 domain-containing protein [Bacteroidia bacterium]
MYRATIVTLSIIASLLFLQACNKAEHTATPKTENTNQVENAPAKNESEIKLTTIKWDTTFYNFGKVKESGGVVKKRFTFTNTGTNPLIIKSAKGSCGCTTAEYIQEPVPPGGKGWVDVKFDPKGREGLTKGKYATVICNTEPKAHKLSYEAEVVK